MFCHNGIYVLLMYIYTLHLCRIIINNRYTAMKFKLVISAVMGLMALASVNAQSPIRPDRPILLIGLDGFSGKVAAEHLKEFPNIEKLTKEGSYTFKSRSVLPSSSAVNWASMFTGSSPELHGFTQATSTAPEVEPRIIGDYGMYPSIFGLMRQQRKSDVTGCFYQWKGLQHVLEEKAISKSEVAAGEDLMKKSIDYISRKKPSLMFVIFDEPDHVGHGSGWDSPEYVEMCKTLDKYVGELVTCMNETFRGKDPIIFIVSDHGGIKKTHGGKTMDEMNPILVIHGKGIRKGYELKDSIMIYDIGATLASFKNLKTPQSWIGRPIVEALVK